MRIIAVLVVCFLLAMPVFGQESLILNTPALPPTHYPDQSGLVDRLMREAFSRLGISVHLQSLPAERALINANEGIEDGDAVRIGGLAQQYPNLIQVMEPAYFSEFVAFYKKGLAVSDWDSLRPYNVGSIIGHKITDMNIKGVKSHEKVRDVETLVKLLANGRVDVIVVEKRFGWEEIKRQKLFDIVASKPLVALDFFVYLHKRHAALVPRIEEALRAMKKDGVFDRIHADFPTS